MWYRTETNLMKNSCSSFERSLSDCFAFMCRCILGPTHPVCPLPLAQWQLGQISSLPVTLNFLKEGTENDWMDLFLLKLLSDETEHAALHGVFWDVMLFMLIIKSHNLPHHKQVALITLKQFMGWNWSQWNLIKRNYENVLAWGQMCPKWQKTWGTIYTKYGSIVAVVFCKTLGFHTINN